MPELPKPAAPARHRGAESLLTGVLLAGAGGYLDGFTFTGHGHVFANAMTGNVVLFGIDALASPRHPSFRHLLPICMFVLGVWSARALYLPRIARLVRHPHSVVLLAEMLILFPLAFLPATAPDAWITSTIAYAASLQVQAFRNVGELTYNSTFATGNLRVLAVGLFEWLFTSKKSESAAKSRVFAAICATFLLGATLGSALVSHFHNQALLFVFPPLLLAAARVSSRSA